MEIKVAQADLLKLAEKGVLTVEKAEEIWNCLASDPSKSQFNFLNVIYYLGALITISAMTWFATEAFNQLRGPGLLVVALVYFLVFFFTGRYLFKYEKTQIPGGLLLTIAVFMVPLLIFSIQNTLNLWVFEAPGEYTDFYSWIRSGWFFMELGTIIASLVLLVVFRFTFLTFPLAFVLWFLSMDIVPIIFGGNFDWDQRRLISIFFGLGMLVVAYSLDKKLKKDYSFWLYLFGLLSFWCALSSWSKSSPGGLVFYCVINLLLIAIAIIFNRKVFIVFGAIGIYLFIAKLSYDYFNGSLLFPFILSSVGILFIALGVLYARKKDRFDIFFSNKLPEFIKAIAPRAK